MAEDLRELFSEQYLNHEHPLLEDSASAQWAFVQQLKISHPQDWNQILEKKTLSESLNATLRNQNEEEEFVCPHVYRLLPGARVTLYTQKGEDLIIHN